MREHGTYVKYVQDRCRCDACRAANQAYEKRRLTRRALGEVFFVDATATRQHLWKLSKAGIGQDQVEKHAGVGHTAQHLIRVGLRRRVLPTTEKAILALDPKDPTLLADGAYVDKTPTMRNVARLIDQFGWTKVAINRQILGGNGPSLQIGRGPKVKKRTADLIAAALNRELETAARGNGTLTCRICGRPYSNHKLSTSCIPDSTRRRQTSLTGRLVS